MATPKSPHKLAGPDIIVTTYTRVVRFGWKAYRQTVERHVFGTLEAKYVIASVRAPEWDL